MTEKELYKELGDLTKNRDHWEDNISYIGTLLHGQTARITAKALWLIGEMGLIYPNKVTGFVPTIAAFLTDQNPLLRERALNALGRIGRADVEVVKPHLQDMFFVSRDEAPNVRLSLIWASENIATNTPELFEDGMELFVEVLNDSDDRVRMEAPEIFRVLGKRRPELVQPYLQELANLSENDPNRVVRIHAFGAIKAAQTQP